MWKDSETEIDYLDFGYLVEIMKDTINDEKLLPSCIGLYSFVVSLVFFMYFWSR